MLGGGRFGHGFASAGFTAFGTSFNNSQHIGRLGFSPLRVAIGATIGGTASRITGGKFVNGAITGAFSQALNQERTEQRAQQTPIAQVEPVLAGVTRVEIENGIIYEREGASVLVQNDIDGGPIPVVNNRQVLDALAASSDLGRQVEIISGERGPGHPLYRPTSPHAIDGAIDVRVQGLSSEEVAAALYRTGRFNRVSSYTDGRTSAHADYNTTRQQGLFEDWQRVDNQ